MENINKVYADLKNKYSNVYRKYFLKMSANHKFQQMDNKHRIAEIRSTRFLFLFELSVSQYPENQIAKELINPLCFSDRMPSQLSINLLLQ